MNPEVSVSVVTRPDSATQTSARYPALDGPSDADIGAYVYRHSHLGILICAADGAIRAANETAARFLGVALADLAGRPVADLGITDADHGGKNPSLAALCRGRQWVARGGETDARMLDIRGGPVSETKPQADYCLIISDVTEPKQTELELMRARDAAEVASRAKSTFLANMSHELRTPLNAIIGFSEIIESEFMGPLGEPRYLDYVGDIHRSARHLLEIINNILDISKIEAGRLELHEESIDVGKLLDSCVNLIRERAMRCGVSLQVDSADTLPLLLADATKVRQIVINLLSNAVKFTAEGGNVALRSFMDEAHSTTIEISDTGIGMSEEELELAMQPFGQVDSDLGRRFEGTGLGLPLTRALINLHGGELQLVSQPGIGTTARVIFPAGRSIVLPSFAA